MIVSETPNRVRSRRLQACVLLCAAVVLPLAMAYAQDSEGDRGRLRAAEAEIRKAVAEGEISAEDARKKMQAIRKAVGEKGGEAAKSERGPDAAKARLAKLKKELGAAVKAGKISEEDAKKKYESVVKAVKERMASARGEGRAKDDGAAVKAREYLAKVKKEIEAAVKAGKISEEDAKKKLEAATKALREKMAAGQGQRDARKMTAEDLAKSGMKIRKLVAEGELTAEEGRAKMEAMRKMAAEKGAGGNARPDLEGIKKRIEGAVESGRMTREQADEAYKGIRERMAKARGEGGGAPPKWIGVRRRIEAAVKNGSMTREEADAKYKEIRETLAKERGGEQ